MRLRAPQPQLASRPLPAFRKPPVSVSADGQLLDLPAVAGKAGKADMAAEINQAVATQRDILALHPDCPADADPGGGDGFERGGDLLDRDPVGQNATAGHQFTGFLCSNFMRPSRGCCPWAAAGLLIAA